MHKVQLKSLALVNFKGVRSLELRFPDQVTVISGENGSGKTTVFDAFLWVLFGKDSSGRSDNNFNIKTLDPVTGKPILHLEHSVTAVLSVNDKDIKLQRCFVEKWFKPTGEIEERLKNHETAFYVNDVKLGTKRDYDAEVANILPEDLFRMITNPFYFTSLKPEVQKQMLLEMAGDVTDEEVAAMKPEYLEMLAQLSGRTLEQFTKEVAAKKKGCREALAVIPSQIETAQKMTPTAENWDELEKELKEKQELLKQYDAQIADKSKVNEEESKRKIGIQQQITDRKLALGARKAAVKADALKGYNEATLKVKELEFQLKDQQKDLQHCQKEIEGVSAQIKNGESELEALREENRSISAEQLQIPEGAFVCPTCKRPLEVEDIEKKQAEMLANFNQSKAAKIKANKDKGMAKKSECNGYTQQRELLLNKQANIEAAITDITRKVEETKEEIPEAPDVDMFIAADQECIDLKNAIAELENQLTMEVKQVDVSELEEAKAMINENIQEIYRLLAKKEQIDRAHKELESLEEKKIQNNQALADYEKWECTALLFQKDKDAKLLERINGLFKVASFSFLSEHLNGNEKITCVCTVNGTPYPDVNNAGKVNAGIDIINAICQSKGVSAPIFIDNRESVNEIIPTISQVINLVVSNDKQLTIK